MCPHPASAGRGPESVFAEPPSPCPQMKVTASRGGDHHSGDDSFHEATSSRRSSSRDQLSDVSAPASCSAKHSQVPHSEPGCSPPLADIERLTESFAFALSIVPSLKREVSLMRNSPLGGV